MTKGKAIMALASRAGVSSSTGAGSRLPPGDKSATVHPYRARVQVAQGSLRFGPSAWQESEDSE
jgi:hypothetical protein